MSFDDFAFLTIIWHTDQLKQYSIENIGVLTRSEDEESYYSKFPLSSTEWSRESIFFDVLLSLRRSWLSMKDEVLFSALIIKRKTSKSTVR